jgi:hypothetical protein
MILQKMSGILPQLHSVTSSAIMPCETQIPNKITNVHIQLHLPRALACYRQFDTNIQQSDTYCSISVYRWEYSGVSFYNSSFYSDSLLRPLSSQTGHSRLVVHQCCDSSVLSLLSTPLALFPCACVSSFSFFVQFF